jgi:hypothetical protein
LLTQAHGSARLHALVRDAEAAVSGGAASSPYRVLLERARNEQWDIERDIDWPALSLDQLGRPVRKAMCTVYSHLHFGEIVGLGVSARLLEDVPSLTFKLFGATQVLDEAKHVDFFARTLKKLGEHAEVSPRLLQLSDEIVSASSVEERFLGIQVVLEGFAQAVFQEGARLVAAREASPIRLPGMEAALQILRYLDAYLGRDESRHVAFGVLSLRERMGDLDPRQRERLELRALGWARAMVALLSELEGALRQVGIVPDELRARVERAQVAHFRAIGFRNLPPYESARPAEATSPSPRA